MRLGLQIKRENGRNHVKIQSNDHKLIQEALEEIENLKEYDLNVEDENRLKYTVKKLFNTHKEFYEYFGFDAGQEHGVTGESFETQGWIKFLNDTFNKSYLKYVEDEEDLQLICDTIAQKLSDVVTEYDDQLIDDDEDFVAKSTVGIDAEPSGELTEPEMLDEAVVVGTDGVHKLKVHTVEDAETLEDVTRQAREDTKQVYERQVEAKVDTLKKRNQRLEEKIEEERQKMLVKGLEMVNELENWKVEDGYLKYTETIHPETVQHRDKDDDPRELTEDAKEKFYVKGLKVEIKSHIKKPKADGDESYHPHVFDWGACSGSFKADMGKEGLEAIIEQLKHIDIHRNAQNDAERDLMNNLEEYIKTDEDGEEVQQELWDAEDT